MKNPEIESLKKQKNVIKKKSTPGVLNLTGTQNNQYRNNIQIMIFNNNINNFFTKYQELLNIRINEVEKTMTEYKKLCKSLKDLLKKIYSTKKNTSNMKYIEKIKNSLNNIIKQYEKTTSMYEECSNLKNAFKCLAPGKVCTNSIFGIADNELSTISTNSKLIEVDPSVTNVYNSNFSKESENDNTGNLNDFPSLSSPKEGESFTKPYNKAEFIYEMLLSGSARQEITTSNKKALKLNDIILDEAMTNRLIEKLAAYNKDIDLESRKKYFQELPKGNYRLNLKYNKNQMVTLPTNQKNSFLDWCFDNKEWLMKFIKFTLQTNTIGNSEIKNTNKKKFIKNITTTKLNGEINAKKTLFTASNNDNNTNNTNNPASSRMNSYMN